MVHNNYLLRLIFFALFISLTLAEKVVVGYFPNWLFDRFPVSKIPMDKYTHIQYAFAIMTTGSIPQWADPGNTETQLPALVEAAHKSNTKVLISVGGWSGSISFSDMAADASSRKEFIDWNIDQISKYGTDGVDIDWEYPGRQGAGCNKVDVSNDVKNFLTLLQELRAALDDKFSNNTKEISIAGYVQAFKTEAGSSDKELTAAIGKVLDRINIMTYDIGGAWNPQTGANSPLNPGPNGGDSFNTAIEFWTSAGVPANKLTGGLPFYGRSTTTKEDMLKNSTLMNQEQVTGKPPKGDSFDAVWQDPLCAQDQGGLSGVWRFGNMLSEGVLESPLKAKAPWVRTWDNATSTPWVYNPDTKVFISYDDPESIAAKVDSANSKGLAGVMIWSVDQDSEENDLLNAAIKG